MTSDCELVLSCPPYFRLGSPSIALSLLKAEAARKGIAARVVYSNHRFAEWLGYDAFLQLEQACEMFSMSWEILFAGCAGFSPRLTMAELARLSSFEIAEFYRNKGVVEDANAVTEHFLRLFEGAASKAAAFLDAEADYILSLHPKVVGCTVMTQQRNGAFALLNRIKQKAPEVVTLLGGGICIGKVAEDFLEKAPGVDYIFTGEADAVFADACTLLLSGRRAEMERRYPAFLKRGGTPTVTVTADMDAMAVPDYSDYFRQIAEESFGDRLSCTLLMESSRGCWWGEKGRCRFCGLHYCKEALAYREKSPERIWREIRTLTETAGCSDVTFVDCILGPRFLRSLPDEPPAERPAWNLFAECKSNLTADDMRRLRQVGFRKLQPGIEAIQDDLLTLMHKGNRAIKHIELLKHARRYGIGIIWNQLHTLPGDRPAWYEDTIRLMPILHHLQPPNTVTPMILMRCSVFEEEAARFGITNMRPQLLYAAMDPDDEAFTQDTAVMLSCDNMIPDPKTILGMNEARAAWWAAFKRGEFLGMRIDGDTLRLRDTRSSRVQEHYALTGANKAVCEAAYSAVGLPQLHAALDGAFGAYAVDEAVRFLTEHRLALLIRGELLALPLPRCLPYAAR